MPQGTDHLGFMLSFFFQLHCWSENSTRTDTQQPTEHKEGLFKKIFDHRHKDEHKEQDSKDKPQGGEGGIRSDLKKDEAGLKKYIKEDEQLEQEGQTYGGLMWLYSLERQGVCFFFLFFALDCDMCLRTYHQVNRGYYSAILLI
jgi:hypothetical protein